MLSAGFLSLFPHYDSFTKNYVRIALKLDTFTFARKKKIIFFHQTKNMYLFLFSSTYKKKLFLFLFLKHKYPEITRRQRSRWMCSTSLSTDTLGYTFKHESACRTPAEGEQVYLTSRKEYMDTHKT